MRTLLFRSPKPFLIGNYFSQWELFFSVYNSVRLYLHSILTMSLEECQTKSFGMNFLLHAIFRNSCFWLFLNICFYCNHFEAFRVLCCDVNFRLLLIARVCYRRLFKHEHKFVFKYTTLQAHWMRNSIGKCRCPKLLHWICWKSKNLSC